MWPTRGSMPACRRGAADMGVLRALAAAAAWLFWSFVAWAGGPRHGSYSYAVFARWQARDYLRRWLRGEL